MKATGGSNHLKKLGKVQVSVYFWPEELKKIDSVAKKNHLKRAAVVRNIVLDRLNGKGN